MGQAEYAVAEIRNVRNGTDAGRVSDFLLGGQCFDDQRFTPGEIEQLRWLPLQSLQMNHIVCRYTEEANQITSAIIFVENEHRSGGYRLEYYGVHREYRRHGLGRRLMEDMFNYCQTKAGRYIETFTCDLPEYKSARAMFERNGFQFMCLLPDYYYEGEGKLLYLKRLVEGA